MACVVTKVAGELTRPVLAAFFAEMGRVAAKHRCTRVLSDLREARIAADPAEIYFAVAELQTNKILRTFRRAIVISNDHDDYRFWETVCKNQGFYFVRIFDDVNKAEDWIRSPGTG